MCRVHCAFTQSMTLLVEFSEYTGTFPSGLTLAAGCRLQGQHVITSTGTCISYRYADSTQGIISLIPSEVCIRVWFGTFSHNSNFF